MLDQQTLEAILPIIQRYSIHTLYMVIPGETVPRVVIYQDSDKAAVYAKRVALWRVLKGVAPLLVEQEATKEQPHN